MVSFHFINSFIYFLFSSKCRHFYSKKNQITNLYFLPRFLLFASYIYIIINKKYLSFRNNNLFLN